jgi:hypothetical protein
MRPGRPSQRSLTSTELRDEILEFIRGKFYPGAAVEFAKDRPRLLAWVVLEPARWLDERGVTIASEQYRGLFLDAKAGVLMEAIRHGATHEIRYRPAWLRMVIQSHLRIHGDELYAQAKSAAVAVENALSLAGRLTVGKQPDPVRELAAASALLRAPARRPQTPCNGPAPAQQDLF